MGHGLALQLLGDGHGLGALGLHELQPRRGGVEEVANLHPRAVRAGEGGRADRADRAGVESIQRRYIGASQSAKAFRGVAI